MELLLLLVVVVVVVVVVHNKHGSNAVLFHDVPVPITNEQPKVDTQRSCLQ